MLGVVVVELGVKGGFLIEKGGNVLSKGLGLQHNHGAGNIPKDLRVVQLYCWNRFPTTCGPQKRSREKVRIATKGSNGGQKEKEDLTRLRIQLSGL